MSEENTPQVEVSPKFQPPHFMSKMFDRFIEDNFKTIPFIEMTIEPMLPLENIFVSIEDAFHQNKELGLIICHIQNQLQFLNLNRFGFEPYPMIENTPAMCLTRFGFESIFKPKWEAFLEDTNHSKSITQTRNV